MIENSLGTIYMRTSDFVYKEIKTTKYDELDESVCGHVLKNSYGMPCSPDSLAYKGNIRRLNHF